MTSAGSSARRPTAVKGRAPRRIPGARSGAVATARPPSPARFAISVRNEQAHLSVPAGRIRKIARLVLAAEEVAGAAISVALVDNRTIHRLNRKHLNHDFETDVLSFLFDSESEAIAFSTWTLSYSSLIQGNTSRTPASASAEYGFVSVRKAESSVMGMG